LAFENQTPFERTTIVCVNFGFYETSLGPRQLSRETLDATLRKDSRLWKFLLASYTSKVLKRRYANTSEITGEHWGPWMVVRTIWNQGAWQTVGLRASTGASKGPGIAAGVLIRPHGAISINIVIHDIE
jgi:hypothetical protein